MQDASSPGVNVHEKVGSFAAATAVHVSSGRQLSATASGVVYYAAVSRGHKSCAAWFLAELTSG